MSKKQDSNPITRNIATVEGGERLDDLVDALTEERNALDSLWLVAEGLVDKHSRRTTINRQPGTVTAEFSTQHIGDTDYYVRLGRLDEKQYDEILFLFDLSKDDAVTTSNIFAMYLKQYAGSAELYVRGDVQQGNIILNGNEYVALAHSVIDDIYGKLALKREQDKALSAEKRRNIAKKIRELTRKPLQFFSDQEVVKLGKYSELYGSYQVAKGKQRKVKLIGWSAAMTALYGHMPFTNEDAKVGFIPLPAPIELLVDGFNMPDHKAQGFAPPEGALVVSIGAEQSTNIPILPHYRTDGVPDSSNDYSDKNESKPGLYRVDIPEDDTVVRGLGNLPRDKVYDINGCMIVEADLTGDKTSVFTLTSGLADKITVFGANEDTLVICSKDETPLSDFPEDGSIYIYQDEPRVH